MMKLNNSFIYSSEKSIANAFKSTTNLPARINFVIQKNLDELSLLAYDIEKIRKNIIEKYGNINEEDNSYNIPKENIHLAQKELDDLLEVEQDVNIRFIKASWLDGFDLTMEQMASIMFMIEEE